MKEIFKSVIQEILEAEMKEHLGCNLLQSKRRKICCSKSSLCIFRCKYERRKKVIGIWVEANESSKFWLGVLKNLKNVYGAVNEDQGLEYLLELKEKWSSTYPNAVGSWENINIMSITWLNCT